MNMRTTIL